jgi:hypothetical protein
VPFDVMTSLEALSLETYSIGGMADLLLMVASYGGDNFVVGRGGKGPSNLA